MKLLTFDWSDQNELAASDTLEFSFGLSASSLLKRKSRELMGLINDYMTRNIFLYTFLIFNPSTINTLTVVCFLFS